MTHPAMRMVGAKAHGVEVPDLVADLRMGKLRELADKLQFTPAEGRIWLEDRRMVLLQTETLAALRAELIESMGQHAARGLLTRLGYNAGCREAGGTAAEPSALSD